MKLLYDKVNETFYFGLSEFPEEVVNQLGDKTPYNEMNKIIEDGLFQNEKIILGFEQYLKKNNLKEYNGIKIIEVPDANYLLFDDDLYTSISPITKVEGSDFEYGT